MTPLAAIVLVAIACCLKDWRRRFPWLLGATLTLPITAAIAVPGLSLPPFFLVTTVLAALVAWEWVRGRIALFSWPGALILLAFLGWTVVVTLAGPTIWSGITVINNRADAGGLPGLVSLGYTTSNVAQIVFLTLSAVAICFLASRSTLSPHLLLPGLGGCMGLSFWRLLSDQAGLWYPVGLVDSGEYRFIDINTADEYRLRGVFTEPSTLAHYSTATLALCMVMLYTQSTPSRLRAVYAGLGIVSVVNLVYAHSGTALVGGSAVVAVTGAMLATRAVRTGRGLTYLTSGACFAGVAVLMSYAHIAEYATSLFESKVNSQSYEGRTGADTFSLHLFLDVFGVGVGLGSHKTSSLWPMLLSTTGVIGTTLFAALVVLLVVRASRTTRGLSAAIVVTSMILTKSVAGSFLSEPLLMLGLGLCAQAAAHGVTTHRRGMAEAELLAAPVPTPVQVPIPMAAAAPDSAVRQAVPS